MTSSETISKPTFHHFRNYIIQLQSCIMDSPTSLSGDLEETDGFDMNEDISAPPNIQTVLLNPYR